MRDVQALNRRPLISKRWTAEYKLSSLPIELDYCKVPCSCVLWWACCACNKPGHLINKCPLRQRDQEAVVSADTPTWANIATRGIATTLRESREDEQAKRTDIMIETNMGSSLQLATTETKHNQATSKAKGGGARRLWGGTANPGSDTWSAKSQCRCNNWHSNIPPQECWSWSSTAGRPVPGKCRGGVGRDKYSENGKEDRRESRRSLIHYYPG